MIPVCEPFIGEKELQYVTDCLKTNWISSAGGYITQFEKKFAAYCGCGQGITTTSGTAALHVALKSIGVGPGDEVIVPTFTMAASVLPIIYTGATPVLIDSEPETWNMNVNHIEAKITKKTKAILPVHIYGHPCNMETITEIAKSYKLYVVEDAAEAHGAEYREKKAGALGDIGCFSFYANKIITTGEGGMTVTSNEELADSMRRLKDLAHSATRFIHSEIGYNYRMTNIQAAIGLAQMEKIDEYVEMRRQNARYYNERLKEIPGIVLPVEKDGVKNVYWMYSIVIEDEFGVSRDELMAKLHDRGVETRSFFTPMHIQPCFIDIGLFQGERYPVAEDLGSRGLYLPSSSGLTAEQIDYVSGCIEEIYRKR